MMTFLKVLRVMGFLCAWVLLLKVFMQSNIHLSLREDPLEEWIALGVAYLLLIETIKQWSKE